ncbi:MAG: DUF1972 domain-containing protein [Burkholderiales bacterium]|nr:DUF1972 domain-containing protein [Burkholderiales bacterium]
MRSSVRILGTRGVPAAHGGFETFAERLALWLVQRGWDVTVYCQEEGNAPTFEDTWQGIKRVHISIDGDGPKSTVLFDWKATRHAAQSSGLCLTLGYNTAIFAVLLRLKGIKNLFNMDGVEWARAKWGTVAKAWFYTNDWAGCWLGNHLVADHPEIKNHLSSRVSTRKITTIPYGADRIDGASEEPVRALGLEPGRYLTLVARAEPENSILEVVTGFSRKPRNVKLVVLGKYDLVNNAYHKAVQAAASPDVKFVGAIYDQAIVRALRFHSLAYVHGHQVGGTNPSLVEALGAGNAVIAHDNKYNRWVAGPDALYFSGADEFAARMDSILADEHVVLDRMRQGSRRRHQEQFTWEAVLTDYERLLASWQ